jgi:Transposase, Mutator family
MAGAERMAIEEVVRKVLVDEQADVVQESVRWLGQQLTEVEVSELIGAERGDRRPEDRATRRNGYRARRWDTRAGEIVLQILKIRQSQLVPQLPAAQEAFRAGVVVGHPAGVRREQAARRPARGEPQAAGKPQRGQPHLRRADDQAEASAPARWRAATSSCSSMPRSRRSETAAGCRQVRGHRPRRAQDRPAGDHRPGRGRRGDRGVLDGLPQGAGRARPGRRAAGHFDTHEGLKNAIARVLGRSRSAWPVPVVSVLRLHSGPAGP